MHVTSSVSYSDQLFLILIVYFVSTMYNQVVFTDWLMQSYLLQYLIYIVLMENSAFSRSIESINSSFSAAQVRGVFSAIADPAEADYDSWFVFLFFLQQQQNV